MAPSTDRRRLAGALAVAGLLVLAGCGGATTTEAPSPTPTATATAGPTATDAPTVAPGLTASRVVDAEALARAHDERLGSTARTTRTRTTYELPDGTVLADVRTTTRRTGSTVPAAHSRTVEGEAPAAVGAPTTDLALWTNGSVTVRRTVANGSTTYATGSGVPDELDGAGTRRATLADLLAATNATVVDERTNAGVSAYRLRGSSRPAGDSRFASSDDVTFTALVGEDGVVREYDVAYRTTVDGRQVRVIDSVRYDALGRTTVTRPGWYANATAA
jgi:hypothetical protein